MAINPLASPYSLATNPLSVGGPYQPTKAGTPATPAATTPAPAPMNFNQPVWGSSGGMLYQYGRDSSGRDTYGPGTAEDGTPLGNQDHTMIGSQDPRHAAAQTALDKYGPNYSQIRVAQQGVPGGFKDPSQVQYDPTIGYVTPQGNIVQGPDNTGTMMLAMMLGGPLLGAAGNLAFGAGAVGVPGTVGTMGVGADGIVAGSGAAGAGGLGTGAGAAGYQGPSGAEEGVPGGGGAGANGYGTPGGTPEQPFGPELSNVNSPTLNPMTGETINPLTTGGGPSLGSALNTGRTVMSGASAVNSLLGGGGSAGGGTSGGGSSGGGGNGVGANGLPDWLNLALGAGSIAAGSSQQNQNIGQYQSMAQDIYNKGDYNQAYRPGYLSQLSQAFSDPDSLLKDKGYQDMRDMQMGNLSRQEAARGMSLSGNEMGDLTKLQSSLDYQQINNTRNQLMSAANLGDPGAMARAQMLTLPLLFQMKNNNDASTMSAIQRLLGGGGSNGAGNVLGRLFGNNGSSGGNIPNIPGGGYPSGSGPSETPQEVDANGNPISSTPGPSGDGPNGPGGDVGNQFGPGAGDTGVGSDDWWDDPSWWQ